MGFLRIFGIGRKGRTPEEEKKEIDVIKQIEAEVVRLEKQWEEKEKEFALVNVNRNVNSWVGNEYAGHRHLYSPNKHFKELWKGLVKLHKRILALESYIHLVKTKEKFARTRRDRRILRKLHKIISYKEGEVVGKLNKEISDFERAIEDGRQMERKYMQELYVNKEYKKLGRSWKGLTPEQRDTHRRLFDPVFREGLGYDFEKRMEFLNYLKKECENLKARLKRIRID